MDIGKRIKARRQELDLSVEDIAKLIGKNKATVYRYENNDIENFPLTVLEPLSKALRCSQSYLIGWTTDPYDYEMDEEGRWASIPSDMKEKLLKKHNGNKQKAWEEWWDIETERFFEEMAEREELAKKHLIPLTFKRVPVLGSIACGEPIFAEQSEGVYVDADSDSDADFALVCRGDSMIGDDIRDGDYVMIRRQEMVDNGEIACVLIGDEATLKHFYFNNGVVTLTAANQKYPPMVFSGHDIDEIRILGKAVGLTRFF